MGTTHDVNLDVNLELYMPMLNKELTVKLSRHSKN